MRPPHRKAHPACVFNAKTWGECDAAADDAYADWQAMQQVLLALNVVLGDRVKGFKGDKGLMGQLVRYVAGEQADIMNDDGNPHQGPWVLRLRRAIDRVKAGDVPGYTLYQIPVRDAG